MKIYILSFFLILTGTLSIAQDGQFGLYLTNGNTVVRIADSTNFVIGGESVNEGIKNQGRIINDGNIIFRGPKTIENANDAEISIGENGTISVPSNLEILGNSNFTGDGFLSLESEDLQQINSETAITVAKLKVTGGGTKTITKTINIAQELALENGVVNLENESSSSNVGFLQIYQNAIISGGNENSYVSGGLIRIGQGDKFFPVGKEGNYFPITLKEVAGQDNALPLSVEVVDLPELENNVEGKLDRILTSPYWNISSFGQNFSASGIEAGYFSSEPLETSGMVLAVSRGITQPFTDLPMASTDVSENQGTLIASAPIDDTTPIVAIGYTSNIKIRNLITPNGDGENDFLIIENIENYSDNMVIISDRMGRVVTRFDNYSNDDPWNCEINGEYVPPGDYLVIIQINEATNPVPPQAVTILY